MASFQLVNWEYFGRPFWEGNTAFTFFSSSKVWQHHMGLQTGLQFCLKGAFTQGLWEWTFLSTYIVKNLLRFWGKKMAIEAPSTGCISLETKFKPRCPQEEQWGGGSRWVPGALQPVSTTNKNKCNESPVLKNQGRRRLRNDTPGFRLASINRCTHTSTHPSHIHRHEYNHPKPHTTTTLR